MTQPKSKRPLSLKMLARFVPYGYLSFTCFLLSGMAFAFSFFALIFKMDQNCGRRGFDSWEASFITMKSYCLDVGTDDRVIQLDMSNIGLIAVGLLIAGGVLRYISKCFIDRQ